MTWHCQINMTFQFYHSIYFACPSNPLSFQHDHEVYTILNPLFEQSIRPSSKSRPRWPHQHWKLMKKLKMDPRKVAALVDVGFFDNVKCLRQRHATWLIIVQHCSLTLVSCMCLTAKSPAKALSIFHIRGRKRGFTNLSQSVDRMGYTQHVPCITPSGCWSILFKF